MGLQPSRVFRPLPAGTTAISVTTSSAATPLPANTMQYRLFNAGSGQVSFEFGTSGVTASASTGTPIPAGATEVFSVLPGVTHIATIGSAAATLYVTAGEGM